MVRAALGGGPSSQDGMKLGCQQVSGMQGLILTVLINAISWFSSVGPRCGARDGVFRMGRGVTKEHIIFAPSSFMVPPCFVI